MRVTHSQRVRWSGALTMGGLAVEFFTFRWSHPIGFSLMLVLGGGLVAMGVALYLSALLSGRETPQEPDVS